MKFSIIFWSFATIIGLLHCLFSFFIGDITSIILSITSLAGIICFLIYYRSDRRQINWLTAGMTLMSIDAVHSLIQIFYK
jgi:hypothetical protein